jgi:tetratricopeptide (TPR) repeat protein
LLVELKEFVDRGVDALQLGDTDAAIGHFEHVRSRAPTTMPAHDVAAHNILMACKQAIERLMEDDDRKRAAVHLQRAFDLSLQGPLAADTAFRGRFADAYYDLGKIFYRARAWETALACVRRAIAIQPCPSYYVDLANALAFVKSRARLEDYTSDTRPTNLGRHLFIACAPKSGSTFLKNLLLDLTRFKDLFSVHAGLQNEQDLDLPQLAKFAQTDTVTQQHCRASEANIHLMQAFGIRPVVLVRDIFDTVVSLRDFYDGGFVYSTFFERESYVRLSEEEKLDMLIDFAVPWYFQFAASWQRAERDGRLDVHWLTYEELTVDTPTALERVLAFHGISARRVDIDRIIAERSVDRRSNRYNQGVRGRGRSALSDGQCRRIEALARFFPETDFTTLGLRSDP